MTISTTTIHQQLRAILALTNVEIQTAEIRQGQARTDAIRTELAGNADKGRARAEAIERALRDRDGLVDVVRPVIGRVGAAIKSIAEQAQPLDEALLADLALEQQLAGRAMYLKALATGQKDTELVTLADRLIDAHNETIEWITTVLAEEALGGPTALRRSPTQWASGIAARALSYPAILTSRSIDRAADALRKTPAAVSGVRDRVGKAVDDVADTATRAGESVVSAGEATARTVAAGRDASGKLRVGGELMASTDAIARLEDRIASLRAGAGQSASQSASEAALALALETETETEIGRIVDESLTTGGAVTFGVRSLLSIRDVIVEARRQSSSPRLM